MTMRKADKAHQIKEQKATELEDANRMEQQCLKRVAAKKEHNHVQKEEEAELKRLENEQHCNSEEAPLIPPTQDSEVELMQVEDPNPGINSQPADMMQVDNDNKQVEVIDPETRRPP